MKLSEPAELEATTAGVAEQSPLRNAIATDSDIVETLVARMSLDEKLA